MIIDGKAIAAQKLEDLRAKIASLSLSASKPKLAVILVGDDPASVLYVNLKKKRAEEIGIAVEVFNSVDVISELNGDPSVTGILVQLPLPKEFNTDEVLAEINPEKDVDGLTDRSKFLPATVKAVFTALEGFEISGKNVTIIGRSREVGKPLAEEMAKRGANVTIAHTQSGDLKTAMKEADILISATGQPGLVTADMVKPGAVVIDVGSPKGDVDFEKVKNEAFAITPVPGGIGPLTVASLLENVVEAAKIGQYENNERSR